VNTDTRDLSEVDRQLLESLAKAFDRRYAPRVSIPVNLHNGSTKFINSMLTILSLLIVAAICGEVVVYGEVQVLQATVNMIVAGHIK
jgi:hypothetical protein